MIEHRPIGQSFTEHIPNKNAWNDLGKPVYEAGVASAKAISKYRKKRIEDNAKVEKWKEQNLPAPEIEAPTHVGPVGTEAVGANEAPNTSYRNSVSTAITAAKASIAKNPDHNLANKAKPAAPDAPGTLDEVPNYAVNKAMTSYYRGQVQDAMHRALNPNQFDN